jgi:hypothetical protein
VVVVPPGAAAARYLESVPCDYVTDGSLYEMADCYLVTLEFGKEIISRSANAPALTRIHKDDVTQSELSTGIHPVVRHYAGGALVDVHHVIEDIESEWVEDVHVRPLVGYFARHLSQLSGVR